MFILTYVKNDVHLLKIIFMTIKPLTPNTGGILKPEQVIGRDTEVIQLSSILEYQSVNVSASRRSGKSSLLFKLNTALDQKDNFVSIYLEVEGIGNCDSFIEKLYLKFKEEGIIKENAIERIDKAFNNLLGRFSKIGLPGGFSAELHKRRQLWEKQLDELLKAVIKENPNKLIVISLDEFSIMLDKIPDEKEACELIGILRSVMHNEPYKDAIRFIYCGSIGIDLVLDKLKKAGNNIGQPLNHMYDFELQPLTDKNALLLAKCFNKGCGLSLDDEQLAYICELGENIPYYIDFLFSIIRYKPKPIDKETIEEGYHSMLNDPNDKAEFKHFYERITLHYPNRRISFLILNFLSKQRETKTEEDILNYLLSNQAIGREELIEELDRLITDDYLIREIKNEGRAYHFKYEILRRWWKLNKSY